MSIASRITEIEQHIGNAYDKIEDLGIDLTDVDKNINNISSMLENVWEEYPKVSASDVEEASLNGTKKGRINIDLKGNTEQEQLSGKNLFDFDYILQHKNDFVKDGQYFMFLQLDDKFKTQFTATTILKGTSQNLVMGFSDAIFAAGGNNKRTLNNGTINSPKTFDFTNATNVYVFFANTSTISADKHEIDDIYNNYNVQVEQGSTVTSYEPYCGGIPSPNPDYPQQIKNVTGNANVKIQNKNLAVTNFSDNISLSGSGNNRTVVPSSYKLSQIIKVKPNTTYSINGDYSSISDQRMRIYYFDEYPNINAVSTKYIYSEPSTAYTFTTDATTQYILLFAAVSPLADVVIPNLQLEEGSTATDFVPHQEQNLPFTFAQSQRAMQGTELLDDGIHNKRIQIVFDGSSDEQWGNVGSYLGKNRIRLIIPNAKTYPTNENHGQLCSHFNYGIGAVSGTTLYVGNFAQSANSTNFYFLIEQTTKEEFLTWLSSNPIMFEIELAESELENNIIPYNTTQQAQYNAIKQARSYDDITYITSESDELGFKMDVESLRKIDN